MVGNGSAAIARAETPDETRKRLRAAAESVRLHKERAAAFTAGAIKCRECLYLYCHPCARPQCPQHCRSDDSGAIRYASQHRREAG